MADMQMFPDTVEEFMEQYKMVDTENVYSNGIEYVPIFRMKQWFEHERAKHPERRKGRWKLHREHERIVYDIPPEGPEPPYHRKITPTYKCSECGFISFDYAPNFCEECGADMREKEENF